MKKLILLLSILCIHVGSYAIFWKQENRAPKIETPRVLIQPLIDPINFSSSLQNLIMNAKKSDIDGVILIIDSVGGSSSQFSALHDLIKKVATYKPVVVFISNTAQSGGYLVASAADYIIAPSCSEIGSIGVFGEFSRHKNLKTSSAAVKADLDVELFVVGKYKGLHHPYNKRLSSDERNYIQNIFMAIYKYFVASVAQNRNLTVESASEWAEGRIFIGSQAIDVGLIDQIGTYFDAEEKIIELVKAKNPEKQYSDSILPVDS